MLDLCRDLKNRINRDTIDFEYSLALLKADLGMHARGICDIDSEALKEGIWEKYSRSKMSFLEKLEIYEFELFELQQKELANIREEKALKHLAKSFEKLETMLKESPNILKEEIAAYIFDSFIQERTEEAKEDLLDQEQLHSLSEEVSVFIKDYSRFLSLDNAATLIGIFSTIKNMINKDEGEEKPVTADEELVKIDEINKALNQGVEKIIQLRNINLELDNIYYKIFHGLSSTLNVDMRENLDNMIDLKKRIEESWTFIRNFKRTLVDSILTIKEMDLEGSRDEMILDVLKKIKTGNQRRKRHSAVIKEKSQKLRELTNKFSAHLISRLYEMNKELQDAGFKGSVLNEAREVADIANLFLKEFNEILKQSRVLYEKFTSYLVDFVDQLPHKSIKDETGKEFRPTRWGSPQKGEDIKPASLTFMKNPPVNEEKHKSSLIFSGKLKKGLDEAPVEIARQAPTGELSLGDGETHFILRKIAGLEKEIRNFKAEFHSFFKDYSRGESQVELIKELNNNIKKLMEKSGEGYL